MALADTNTWTTSIADVQPHDVLVRGQRLTDLLRRSTFAEMAYLVLKGEAPTSGQARVLDAMLVAAMEHGISPSSMVSRLMASYGVPIQVGIASGALTIGDYHGGAGEATAHAFEEIVKALPGSHIGDAELESAAAKYVASQREAGLRVEGFGHPQHDRDPRVPILLEMAKDEGVSDIYCSLLQKIETALANALGRRVFANFDGVSAALILDLGLDFRVARPLIISARTIGLAAHFIEESDQQSRWRHVPGAQVNYTGPPAGS
jgi:citrate synthase